MKKIFISIVILTSVHVFSQVKYYDELALQFSQEKLNGTARFLGMSGAYGAVGGDLSAVEINPAGMAFFNDNTAALTTNLHTIDSQNTFYNEASSYNSTRYHFIDQAGVVGVFKTQNAFWRKFALSINTSVSNNFNTSIRLYGNNHLSNTRFFLEPNTLADSYNDVTSQKMTNYVDGDNSKTTFSIATKYNEFLYFGFSIITNTVSYSQEVSIVEESKDSANETFRGTLNQTLDVDGDGVSFGFGFIAKPVKNLRVGLALQTPSWYTLAEHFTENSSVYLSDSSIDIEQPEDVDAVSEYEFKSPGKITGSIAYIFDKKGLISLDYKYTDYGYSKFKPKSDFDDVNDYISEHYNAVSSVNIGGEYRLKYISLRAGFHYKDSPYDNTTDLDSGYSLGFGFKTGRYSKLDFSFNQSGYTDYGYYLNASKPIVSKVDSQRITATYSVTF